MKSKGSPLSSVQPGTVPASPCARPQGSPSLSSPRHSRFSRAHDAGGDVAREEKAPSKPVEQQSEEKCIQVHRVVFQQRATRQACLPGV